MKSLVSGLADGGRHFLIAFLGVLSKHPAGMNPVTDLAPKFLAKEFGKSVVLKSILNGDPIKFGPATRDVTPAWMCITNPLLAIIKAEPMKLRGVDSPLCDKIPLALQGEDDPVVKGQILCLALTLAMLASFDYDAEVYQTKQTKIDRSRALRLTVESCLKWGTNLALAPEADRQALFDAAIKVANPKILAEIQGLTEFRH